MSSLFVLRCVSIPSPARDRLRPRDFRGTTCQRWVWFEDEHVGRGRNRSGRSMRRRRVAKRHLVDIFSRVACCSFPRDAVSAKKTVSLVQATATVALGFTSNLTVSTFKCHPQAFAFACLAESHARAVHFQVVSGRHHQRVDT